MVTGIRKKRQIARLCLLEAGQARDFDVARRSFEAAVQPLGEIDQFQMGREILSPAIDDEVARIGRLLRPRCEPARPRDRWACRRGALDVCSIVDSQSNRSRCLRSYWGLAGRTLCTGRGS